MMMPRKKYHFAWWSKDDRWFAIVGPDGWSFGTPLMMIGYNNCRSWYKQGMTVGFLARPAFEAGRSIYRYTYGAGSGV